MKSLALLALAALFYPALLLCASGTRRACWRRIALGLALAAVAGALIHLIAL